MVISLSHTKKLAHQLACVIQLGKGLIIRLSRKRSWIFFFFLCLRLVLDLSGRTEEEDLLPIHSFERLPVWACISKDNKIRGNAISKTQYSIGNTYFKIFVLKGRKTKDVILEKNFLSFVYKFIFYPAYWLVMGDSELGVKNATLHLVFFLSVN